MMMILTEMLIMIMMLITIKIKMILTVLSRDGSLDGMYNDNEDVDDRGGLYLRTGIVRAM